MMIKSLLIATTTLFLVFSSTVFAKKPEGKGNPHNNGYYARGGNSNKQSDEFSLRGKERAKERHQLKKLKHKKKKHSDQYLRNNDQYKQRRYEEKYRNNPIGPIIDRTINNTKSIVYEAQRKANETIENKTREIIRNEGGNKNIKATAPWWWPF